MLTFTSANLKIIFETGVGTQYYISTLHNNCTWKWISGGRWTKIELQIDVNNEGRGTLINLIFCVIWGSCCYSTEGREMYIVDQFWYSTGQELSCERPAYKYSKCYGRKLSLVIQTFRSFEVFFFIYIYFNIHQEVFYLSGEIMYSRNMVIWQTLQPPILHNFMMNSKWQSSFGMLLLESVDSLGTVLLLL